MARKTYTEADRARIRQALLDAGLETAAGQGLRGLHLASLTAAVGISKPYFYTFFDSLEEFCLQLLEEQRRHVLDLLRRELAAPPGSWEDRAERFFQTLFRHREHGIWILTQQEEAYLHSRVDPARFQAFRPGQRAFMAKMLELLDIPQDACRPEVAANLVFSLLLVCNSAPQSMPFLFTDDLDQTAELAARLLVRNYLAPLRRPPEDR